MTRPLQDRAVTASTYDWPTRLFRYDKRTIGNEPNRVDLTGRGRSLVIGPNRVVQAGLWRLRVRLAFDEWAAKHRYALAWGADEDRTVYEFCPGREGVFEVELDARWDQPAKAKLRLRLVDASMGGVFEFRGAQAFRLDDEVRC
ncbi:hypothetical protein [Brevundimonas olei]|uniref:hypothetical protein n=1 Tax=Brevundimonas olei TaxID=657642 RepID=UPI0031CF5E36